MAMQVVALKELDQISLLVHILLRMVMVAEPMHFDRLFAEPGK